MTSYPPLADVRKSLRVDWYRCPIEPAKLRELSKRSDLQGWFQAGGHLALFAVTGFVQDTSHLNHSRSRHRHQSAPDARPSMGV